MKLLVRIPHLTLMEISLPPLVIVTQDRRVHEASDRDLSTNECDFGVHLGSSDPSEMVSYPGPGDTCDVWARVTLG